MSVRPLLLAAAFAAAVAAPAFAHHGWAGQDTKVTELTGVVMEAVNLDGPHGTMRIMVDRTPWDITLAPPARTAAAGLRPATIPVGDTITVRGNRSLAAGRNEMKTILVIHNGKRYAVYPERQ